MVVVMDARQYIRDGFFSELCRDIYVGKSWQRVRKCPLNKENEKFILTVNNVLSDRRWFW